VVVVVVVWSRIIIKIEITIMNRRLRLDDRSVVSLPNSNNLLLFNSTTSRLITFAQTLRVCFSCCNKKRCSFLLLCLLW
jgi:hypothetical protein